MTNSFFLDNYSIIFTISIAFQLSGALALLISSLTNKGISKSSFGEPEAFLDNNGYFGVGYSKPKEARKRIVNQTIIKNRIAFCYLALGYLLSVFSSNNGNYFVTLLYVVIMSTILLLLEELLSRFLSKKVGS